MKPRLYYDSYRRAYYLQWDVSDHVGWQEMVFERTREYICGLADENAKLRNELANAPKCEACEAMLDCDECLRADGSHKERRRLSTENAKLRELVLYMWDFSCVIPDEPRTSKEELDYSVEVWKRMRELGIEVDG